MKHSGKVLSREQLLDQAWGNDGEITDRAVDVSVRRLRKALKTKAMICRLAPCADWVIVWIKSI